MDRNARVTARLRYLAATTAGLTALLYVLIGLEVLPVGRPSDGSAPDLLAFGLIVGGMFAVAAVLLFLVSRRVVWLVVGALQLLVIVGYFALAEVRDPPFAPWGLAIKALQVVILGVVAYLAIRGTRLARTPELAQR
jgi:hypothetical protein